MADQAQGNILSTATNPSSVGAVFFDKAVDPLRVQQDINADLAAWQRGKEAEAAVKKLESEKKLADINFDASGIYDYDTQYFTEGAQKLVNGVVELKGLPPNSPAYNEKMREMQLAQKKYATEVQASKQHKELLGTALKEFDPSKHDQKRFDKWVDAMRNSDIQKRIEYAQMNPLQNRVKNFQEEFGKRVADGRYIPKVTEKEITTPQGQLGVETITAYDPENVKMYAKTILTSDSDLAESAKNDFEELSKNDKILFQQIVDEANTAGIDPLEMFVRKNINNASTEKKELKDLKETAMQKAYANDYYGSSKKVEKSAEFFIDQMANLLNGNQEVYTIGGEYVTSDVFGMPVASIESMQKGLPAYSDMLQGFNAPDFTIIEKVVTGKGDDATTKNVITKSPNKILSWRYIDGKPYLKTTESAYRQMKGGKMGQRPIDEAGYYEFTKEDAASLALANGIPADAFRKVLEKRGGYENKIADVKAGVPQGTKVNPQVNVVKDGVVPKEDLRKKYDY